jgi:hypothetical protein
MASIAGGSLDDFRVCQRINCVSILNVQGFLILLNESRNRMVAVRIYVLTELLSEIRCSPLQICETYPPSIVPGSMFADISEYGTIRLSGGALSGLSVRYYRTPILSDSDTRRKRHGH